jgi:hypothetical protein
MTLRPQDVAVALQLVLTPDVPISHVAEWVRLSRGEVHNSEQRLRAARLVRRLHRAPDHGALLEFIIYGVPYAYPGIPGASTKGVPTGSAGPGLRGLAFRSLPLVWPSEQGEAWGAGLTPLYPGAVGLAGYNAYLYEWLTLIDALRAGRPRERDLARSLLADVFRTPLPRPAAELPPATAVSQAPGINRTSRLARSRGSSRGP